MEFPETPRTEEFAEGSSCGAAPLPPKIEEEALDILAFELWQRACRQDLAAEEDCSNDEETVASHASCL